MTNQPNETVRQVLTRLKKVKPAGKNAWKAQCPAHNDNDPSLSISQADDGKVLLCCHAGCSVTDICKTIGLSEKDLFPAQSLRSGREGKIEVSYPYRDEHGKLLFEVIRLGGKKFYQRRPDGKDGWINDLKGVRRVLYHLPELVDRSAETIFIAEGEKDVETLAKHSLLATTNPGGAGKWRAEYNETLADRDIVILPDNDEPGRRHAEEVARSVVGAARSVKLVDLPELPEKGDVSDWLAADHTVEELKSLVAETPAWQPPADVPTNGESGTCSQSRRQANRVARMVLDSGAILFRDERGMPYVSVPLPNGRRNLSLMSPDFKQWVSRLIWQRLGQVYGADVVSAANLTLGGIARFDREEHRLDVRSAWRDGAIWVDLDGTRAIRITPNGWEIVSEPPIMFRSFRHHKPLPEPVKGGDPWKVIRFVNLHDEDTRLLFLCYLVAAMVPNIPVAALIVHGVQGSAKTTFLKVVKNLLDPSALEVYGGVRGPNDFALAAWQNRVVFFDNITSVKDWLSDALCRAVTGEGWSKRTLFTDEDTTIFAYKRVIGLAGINLVANRPDLLDRAIILALDRVPPDERRDEQSFWRDYDRSRPAILGGLLDALSKAMRIVPELDLPFSPRMADFARWGAAAAEALGHGVDDFIGAYDRNVERQNEAAIEASPVAQAVLALMEKHANWEGTPTELLTQLDEIAESSGIDTRSKNWPKASTWIIRRLREVQPNLLDAGIQIRENRSAKRRKIILRKTSEKVVTAVTGVTSDPGEGGSVTTGEAREAGPVSGVAAAKGQGDESDANDDAARTSSPAVSHSGENGSADVPDSADDWGAGPSKGPPTTEDGDELII